MPAPLSSHLDDPIPDSNELPTFTPDLELLRHPVPVGSGLRGDLFASTMPIENRGDDRQVEPLGVVFFRTAPVVLLRPDGVLVGFGSDAKLAHGLFLLSLLEPMKNQTTEYQPATGSDEKQNYEEP